MPNWCTNDVVITSKDEAAIKRLAKTLTDVDGVPCKKTAHPHRQNMLKYDAVPALGRLFDDYEQHKNDDSIAWNEANLGVKWDCCNSEPLFVYYDTRTKRYTMTFWFDSPWTCPDLAFNKMAKSFPEVRIRVNYREEGMAFKGCLWYNKGKKTLDRASDI